LTGVATQPDADREYDFVFWMPRIFGAVRRRDGLLLAAIVVDGVPSATMEFKAARADFVEGVAVEDTSP
jgi:hypothetical protein